MKWSKRSEIIVAAVLLFFITLGGLLWWTIENQGLEPPICVSQVVGQWGPIKLAFMNSMLASTVDTRKSISPEVAGRWEWQGNNLLFFPLVPLKPLKKINESYVIRLTAGAQNLKGKTITHNQSCNVTVRQPDIIYQTVGGLPGVLMEMGVDGKNTRILAEFKAAILYFKASPDGASIAAAVQNQIEGSDLWIVDRANQTKRLLVECRQDICEDPTWAPGGKEIIYSRSALDAHTSKTRQPTQIWRYNLETLKSVPLVTSQPVGGLNPQYASDGQKIAFFDRTNEGIRIILLNGADSILLKSNSPIMAWSPDSTSLLYFNDVVEAENHYMNTYLYHLSTRKSEILLNEYKGQFEFGFPVWSPDGQWITMAARLAQGGMSKQLIMLRVDGSDVKTVTDTQVFTHSSYHWNPDGDLLVYQRLELGTSSARPQILVWNSTTGTSTVLVQGGGMPDWLP